MTDTRACVAFLSVCLWALLAIPYPSGAQAWPASSDGLRLMEPARAGFKTAGRPEGLDDFSDLLASGEEGPVMVVVPAGTFQMGCVEGRGCFRDELPVREVALSHRFALSKHEITFADWDACVEAGGCAGYLPDDEGWGRGGRPVIHVSWHDAQAYVQWLSYSTREAYRLPSEAEWEYAARAGTETRYHWGNDFVPNLANCRDERCRDAYPNTAPAGSFPANAWGLHDMIGNVFEWVQDCWHGSTYEGAPTDGSAWVEGDCTSRLSRGGGWLSVPENLRSANRVRNPAGERRDTLGFRVVRELPAAGSGIVPLVPAAAVAATVGVVRVINHSETGGEVIVNAVDDSGRSYGPITLSVDAGATVQFNSNDLEQGNAAKGLPDGTGPGVGDWRLRLASILDIEILSFIRTPDGFLTAMRQTVPATEGRHRVPIFNPGRNRQQVSHLRLVNPGEQDAEVEITGMDDDGRPGGTVSLTLAARNSRTVSAQQLEDGGGDLEGELGTGRGKWRLTVMPSAPILVMNLLESPTGHITNLSATPAEAAEGKRFLPFFPAKSSLGREGFVRVINLSRRAGRVQIDAIDDDGNRPGAVTLSLDAGAAANFNSQDLEDGAPGKRLVGTVGAGTGDWRLELGSDLELEVLAYVRTEDGFVTAMHEVAPRRGIHSRIAVFNPGSNRSQVSNLRLVNATTDPAEISIRAVDDAGDPGGRVALTLPAGQARVFSAWELESGGGDLRGGLGDGAGKWQLELASERPVVAMSLLKSPTGHLTNLSGTGFRRMRLAGAREIFEERVSGPVAQSSCVGCHVAGGEAGDTRLTLVPDTTADHATLNRQAFVDFLADVQAGESLILAKTRGDADHGGGVQLAEHSPEYAGLVRFLRLVVEESSASFDSITYAGSATFGNGEIMAAGDLLVEAPARTLLDDIAVIVNETSLPAALPSGISQIADAVEILIADQQQHYLNGPLAIAMTYPQGSRQDGDLVALRYEPASDRWFAVTVRHHDPGDRTVVIETRAFGHFVLARATSPLPGSFTTGFDPAKHGFSIDNERFGYHTKGGNAFGMCAYAVYHYTFGDDELYRRWDFDTQALVTSLAQSATSTMYVNGRWWRSFRFDRVSSVKQAMRSTRSPAVLMLSRPAGGHAVVAYGYQGDELLVYDPSYPGRTGKTTGGGRQLRSLGRSYSVSHAVQLSSVGRVEDFESLKNAADEGFAGSELLGFDVADGQEVYGRKLPFRVNSTARSTMRTCVYRCTTADTRRRRPGSRTVPSKARCRFTTVRTRLPCWRAEVTRQRTRHGPRR